LQRHLKSGCGICITLNLSLLLPAFLLLFLLLYLLITGQVDNSNKPPVKILFQSAITGALNPFGYYLILFKAYSLLPAQLAQPLNMIWPVTLSDAFCAYAGTKNQLADISLP
jgi:drug/metabolite transporter (DMT)-like permease